MNPPSPNPRRSPYTFLWLLGLLPCTTLFAHPSPPRHRPSNSTTQTTSSLALRHLLRLHITRLLDEEKFDQAAPLLSIFTRAALPTDRSWLQQATQHLRLGPELALFRSLLVEKKVRLCHELLLRMQKKAPSLQLLKTLKAQLQHTLPATPPPTRLARPRPAPPHPHLSSHPPPRHKRETFQKSFFALRQRVLNPNGGLLERLALIHPQELQKRFALKDPLIPLFLQGIPRSQGYDAWQFVWANRPTARYLFALQVWRGRPQTLNMRWNRFLKTYPQARSTHPSPVGRAAFFARRAPMHYLVIHSNTGSTLFSMSCHQSICPKANQMLPFARLAEQRLHHQTSKKRPPRTLRSTQRSVREERTKAQ